MRYRFVLPLLKASDRYAHDGLPKDSDSNTERYWCCDRCGVGTAEPSYRPPVCCPLCGYRRLAPMPL